MTLVGLLYCLSVIIEKVHLRDIGAKSYLDSRLHVTTVVQDEAIVPVWQLDVMQCYRPGIFTEPDGSAQRPISRRRY